MYINFIVGGTALGGEVTESDVQVSDEEIGPRGVAFSFRALVGIKGLV